MGPANTLSFSRPTVLNDGGGGEGGVINVQICLFAKSRITIHTGFFFSPGGNGTICWVSARQMDSLGKGSGRRKKKQKKKTKTKRRHMRHSIAQSREDVINVCDSPTHIVLQLQGQPLARSLSRCWAEPGFHLTGEEALQHTWSVGRDDCRTAPQGGTNHRTGGRLLLSGHEKKGLWSE